MAKKPHVSENVPLSAKDTWLTSVPVTREPLDEDAYVEFQRALPSRTGRVALGLHIPDSDAELLLSNKEWQETFFREWTGEFVTSAFGAPVAHARTSTSERAPRRPSTDSTFSTSRTSVTRQPIRIDDVAEDEPSAA